MNAIRVAWDTCYRGSERKSPAKCINGIHLRRQIRRRPSAITRGDSNSNCDDHVNHDEDTAASPSGTGALYKKNVSPLSSLPLRREKRREKRE